MEVPSLDGPAIAYRTFPRRLPLALTTAGGVLAALGAIGTWVRATVVTSAGLPPQQVEALRGYSLSGGRALIALGILAAAGGLGWLARDGGARALPIVATLLAIGIGAWQLMEADSRAAGMAEAARSSPAFVAYHASFGWGAWLLLLSLVVLFLGLVVGVLREVDLRRPPREAA